MVTSTIMKDTGGSTDVIFRPNAIRALCRIIDVCSRATSSLGGPTNSSSGNHCPIHRTCHEDCDRRQEPLSVLRRARVILPPPANCQRCCPPMAERDPRSRGRDKILGRLFPRLLLVFESIACQQFHNDPIPRYWSAISNAHARQDGIGQDGATIRGCRCCQEPCCHCNARASCGTAG